MHTQSFQRLFRPAGIGVILVAIFAMVLFAAPSAGAQDASQDGCDASEQIACIPLPADGEGGEAPSVQSGEAGAATAPSRVLLPPNRCPPIFGPRTADTPVASPEAPAIAAPLPISQLCARREVVATVNRANVLWARALRSLDTRELSAAWRGEALAQVSGYVQSLRSSGRYATPQLLSITMTSLQLYGDRASVVTIERWLYQERSRLSGAVIYEDDQRVSNLYELRRQGGAWYVTYNEVGPADPPIVPRSLPPTFPPPGMPCILIYPPPAGCEPTDPPAPIPGPSATVTSDRASYQLGETVRGTVTNTGAVTLTGGGSYRCGLIDLEVLGPGGWSPAPGGAEICPAIALLLRPGESRTEELPAGPPRGSYRLVARLTDEQGNRQTFYSAPFVVQ